MLCQEAAYGPTVLFARQRVRGAHVEQHDPAFGKTGIFSPGIYRLILVEDGSCRVRTSAGEEVLRDGQVGLLQPGSYTDVSMARDSRAVLVGFLVLSGPEIRRDLKGRAFFLKDEQHHQPGSVEIWGQELAFQVAVDLLPQVIDDIRQIAACWWQDDWHHFRANHLLGQLLYRLADQSREPSQAIAVDRDHWLSQVQQLIDERLPLLRTTSDLAAVFDRNPKALARSFKARVGVSPAVYLRRRRLERAIELVRSTRLPIHAIAEQVGYRHVAALDHAWKQRFTIPPLAWRRLHQ